MLTGDVDSREFEYGHLCIILLIYLWSYIPSSDDQLLQDGGCDENSIESQLRYGLNINQAPASAETSIGVGRFNRDFRGSSTMLVQRYILYYSFVSMWFIYFGSGACMCMLSYTVNMLFADADSFSYLTSCSLLPWFPVCQPLHFFLLINLSSLSNFSLLSPATDTGKHHTSAHH